MEQLLETKNLILIMVKAVVKFPEEVEINILEVNDDKGGYTQINIKTAESDIPQAIGSKGSTADAVRKIATLHAVKNGYEKKLYFRVDAPVMPKNHFYQN